MKKNLNFKVDKKIISKRSNWKFDKQVVSNFDKQYLSLNT